MRLDASKCSRTAASVLALFFITTQIHHVHASVGVVDIDDMLHTKDQHMQAAVAAPPLEDNDDDESPWSHDPFCTHSTSLSSLGRKYCVYTSNLTGPTGISLIASPAVAAQAAHLLNDNPLDNFLTMEQAEALYLGTAPPYKIVPIDGKGMGVLARRRIQKFETLMVDQAAVVVDLALEKTLSKRENGRLLAEGVRRLRVPGEVWALSAEHAKGRRGKDGDGIEEGEEVEEGRLEEDVMMTNAFGSQIAGTQFRALYPLVSRINHACNPNAYVLFSRAGISMAVKAYRDILPGEEITISYITLHQPSPSRATALARWGFSCTCALCTLPPTLQSASDTRRALIAHNTPHITSLHRSGQVTEAIALAHETVQLVEEEAGHTGAQLLVDLYALLARLYKDRAERGDRSEGKGDIEADRRVAGGYMQKCLRVLGEMGFLGRGWEAMDFDLEQFLEMVGEGFGGGVGDEEEERAEL